MNSPKEKLAVTFLSLTPPNQLQEIPAWLASEPMCGGWHEYKVGDYSDIADGEFDPPMDLTDFLFVLGFENVQWVVRPES